jgi:hypothetical protein
MSSSTPSRSVNPSSSSSSSSSSGVKAKNRKSTGDAQAKVARLSEPLQECYQIIKFFQSRPDAEAFTRPVDWEAFGLMDYPEIITHPMDLGTVQVRKK